MPTYEYKCRDCGQIIEVWYRSFSSIGDEQPQCTHCSSTELTRIMSAPGLVRSTGGSQDATLRAVPPRKMVEQMSRQYDKAGVDPGGSFDDIARQAARGASPETLKEAVKEARKNEKPSSSSGPSKTEGS